MIADRERFEQAIARFDAANAEDPNHESVAGQAHPKELVYAQRVSEMLQRFAPESSEALQLAARCQHIRRWTIPRSDYPQTTFGYKQWRTHLKKFHAETAARILREVGYDDETVAKVQSLLRKEALKVNADTQTLEDIVDLVFLEYHLDDFVKKYSQYDEAKLADILRKTWKKMSPRGHEAALKLIHIPAHLVPFVVKAVSGETLAAAAA
jgi:hypothetical protein